MTIRTGVWLYPNGSVTELVDAVVLADSAGIDEVWIADEGVMRDPVVVFAAAAAHTSRVRMGIGITSPALRHPGAIAATVASLDELSGGRMMLGFGVGGDESLAPFGITVDRPVALIRDALRISRAVLQRRSDAGYDVADHAAPARVVPLYVASRGEQINRLASRGADGVFLSGFEPTRLATVLDWVRSEGSPIVALYQSVRFRPSEIADPTSIVGSPSELAEALRTIAETHRPDVTGIALVDGDSIGSMMEHAVATLDLMRRQEVSSRG